MAALDNNPTPQDAANSKNDGSAPIARKAGSRGDAAVIATLLPYLRPYVGRIALALGLIVAAKLANLYAELQRAAVRRASVSEINEITSEMGRTRALLGEGSEVHKQVMYLRQVADAYAALLQEL